MKKLVLTLALALAALAALPGLPAAPLFAQSTYPARGVQIIGSDPATLGDHVKSEMARWADVVKRYNIKAE